jgi:hypothetical protein
MNELLEWYKILLLSLNCEIDNGPDYNIRWKIGESNELVKVSGLQLVFPTKELLAKDNDWKKIIAFHPTCENILGGQSPILNMLCLFINHRIITTLLQLSNCIVELGRNTDIQESLTNKQSEFLSQFTFDKASVELLGRIERKTTFNVGDFPLLSIRLERGGEIAGIKYLRVCNIVPHFKLTDGKICGVTPSSKTSDVAIRSVFTNLLPDQLSYGSNSQNQPYLRALLETYYRMVIRLNNIIKIFDKKCNVLPIDVTWYSEMDNLQKIYKQCLPQVLSGNIGQVIKGGSALHPEQLHRVEGVKEEMTGQEKALLKLNTSRNTSNVERSMVNTQNEIYERDAQHNTPSRTPPRIIEEARTEPRLANNELTLKIRTEPSRNSIIPSRVDTRDYHPRERADNSTYNDYRNNNSRESYPRERQGYNLQSTVDLRFGNRQR